MANEAPHETHVPTEPAITLPRGPDVTATDAAQSVPMPPLPASDSSRGLLDKLDWFLLALVVVLSFLAASVPAFNPDVWMQLATGRLIAQGEFFPGAAEPFSVATEAGVGHEAVRWVNHSWLFALFLFLLYRTIGGAGVIVLKALLVALLTIVLMQVRSSTTPRLLIALCVGLTVLALSPRLFLQPVLVSYFFLGLTLFVLHRAGVFASGGEALPGAGRWLWSLPALMVVWVNFDNWFILGPLTVALSGIGLLIRHRRTKEAPVPVSRFGALVGICFLACLVNPFHVYAFQLPPDLAYLLVRGGDAVGIALPDALVAGGRTLAFLQEFDPQTQRNLSPFSFEYLSRPTLGYTVAGVCFFPLLLLGLVAFTLNGIFGRAGGPALQPARLLVWLFFALLASLMVRLIPFFVIVAGPLTALTLGELLAWHARPKEGTSSDSLLFVPLRLARLVGVLVMAALLLLAWPGWLTGPRELGSRLHHVAWDIPVDASLRLAAERLGELQRTQAPERPLRVFSTGFDLSCYLAWFAPNVKSFFDTRYNLFPHVAADYAKAKRALFDKQRRPSSEFANVLAAHRLDHVAVENFLNSPLAVSWWAEPATWLQRFADRNVAVFAWSGPQPRFRDDAILHAWNTQAFGKVARAERPPAGGLSQAPEPRSLLDRYWEPPPTLPQPALDMDLKVKYAQFIDRRATEIAFLTLPSASPSQARAPILPMYGFASLPLSPGEMAGPWSMTLNLSMLTAPEFKGFPFWRLRDSQPPAVPILLTRSAWQTVHAAPSFERCHVYLANAHASVKRQENFWINPSVPPPPSFRSSFRDVQILSALRAAVEVGLTEPGQQYQVHRDLSDLYLEKNHLDLAAEHLALADQAWEASAPSEPQLQEGWRKEKKQLGEVRKLLDTEVAKRLREFQLKTANRKAMEKVYEAIAQGSYRRVTKDNREEIEPGGWGLTGMTLQLLQEIDPRALSREEQLQWGQLTIDLLYKTGHARQAAEVLKEFQGPLKARALPFRVFRAGTQGDYTELGKVLMEWDELLAEHVRKSFQLALSTGLMAPSEALGQTYFMMGMTLPGGHFNWVEVVSTLGITTSEYFSTKTLRGVMALEAGETAEALRHFDTVLRESRDLPFAERPLAERYATFLTKYQR